MKNFSTDSKVWESIQARSLGNKHSMGRTCTIVHAEVARIIFKIQVSKKRVHTRSLEMEYVEPKTEIFTFYKPLEDIGRLFSNFLKQGTL